jgi:hypothetical protein
MEFKTNSDLTRHMVSHTKHVIKRHNITVEEVEMTASDEDGIRRRAIELRLLKLANEKKDLGNQCLKDKEYRKAIEHYSAGIVADKKSAVLYANRAQAYMYLKE